MTTEQPKSEIVTAKAVSKSFGSLWAVHNLDLSIRSGECFGLLGPNGAGKSTLIKMIYGVTAKTSGDLTVMGYDPATQFRLVRSQVGVVMQEDALDDAMNVRENMLMFCRFHNQSGRPARRKVDELLEFMSLTQKADARIATLSGGMRRRLSFVRSLISNPRLLILDEPTTGLDPAVRQLLWDKILELKKNGTTILLTTHYMDEAELLCDRIAIMDSGAIQAESSPKDLVAKYNLGYVAMFENPDDRTKLTRIDVKSLLEIPMHAAARGAEPIIVRPANLEDVFLKLTGRQFNV